MPTQSSKDDFWDLDKLVPKQKSAMRPFATREPSVSYEIPSAENRSSQSPDERKLSFAALGSAKEDQTAYRAKNSLFLKSVTISRLTDRFDFYDTFRKAALCYYEYKTPACPFVPYYSYMPQYSQLNPDQKAYYFYWRDQLRMHKYLESDQSYLYLYAYEILNLPDKISPEEGLKLLCEVFLAYRNAFPRIDHYFVQTLQDYCLLYELPCPAELLGGILPELIPEASLKEFFLPNPNVKSDANVSLLLRLLSDYDYKAGKFAGGESAELYARHMIGAMRAVLSLLEEERFLIGENSRSVIYRTSAFKSSICTLKVKCRMEVEYYPVAQAIELRRIVTEAVRYAENKLRALIGVKSRLGIKNLPEKYAAAVDSYFADEFKKLEQKRKRESLPAYESRYDAPAEKLSFAGADEIERLSWMTTARLVPTEETEDEETVKKYISEEKITAETDSAAYNPTAEPREERENFGLSKDEIAFLSACGMENPSERKQAENEIARKLGRPIDAIADRINEAFADFFGDVVLEPCDGAYARIEDYEEEISEWITKQAE